jgi:hypothetical protein
MDHGASPEWMEIIFELSHLRMHKQQKTHRVATVGFDFKSSTDLRQRND